MELIDLNKAEIELDFNPKQTSSYHLPNPSILDLYFHPEL